MVDVIYIKETIRYDKTKVCGWSYREIECRINYKTKNTRFIKYIGYCQWDHEYLDDDAVEEISIHCNYLPFPVDIKKRYNKIVRKGSYDDCDCRYTFKE